MLSRYRRRRVKWLPLLGFTPQTRDNIVAWRKVGLGCLLVLAVVFNQLSNTAASYNDYETDPFGASRKLLANSSDSSGSGGHGPEWERCDFEKSTSSGAWIFSHTICILIIFIAIAIVCDDFFVPSLELISEKLQLSEDVAGATFMAAGSSAPELFTSVAGVAVQTDVGVGTIVGSAVFNLLIIIALTAALAGQVLFLDWRPLIRDAFFYAMSIGCFIGFAWDGFFVHYEAVILLCLYSLYIILMVFNPRLMDWMATWRLCCGGKVEPSDEEDVKDTPETEKKEEDRKLSLSGGHARRITVHKNSLNELQQAHIFHHHRGSVAGVLMLHNPPTRHCQRDGPFSRENSLLAKHQNSTESSTDPYVKEDTLRPPVSDDVPMPIKSNDIEMQRRNSAADSTSSGDMLLPAITVPNMHSSAMHPYNDIHNKNPTSPIATVPNLPTISSESGEDSSMNDSNDSLAKTGQTTAKSSLSTNRLTPVEQPMNNNMEPTNGHVGNVTTPRDQNVNSKSILTNQGSIPVANGGVRKHSLTDKTIVEEKENGDVPQNTEENKEEEEEDEEKTINMCPCLPCCCPVRTWPPDSTQAREEGGIVNWFKLIVRWVLFIPAFPFVALFSWTIPDCSKDHLRKYYLLSFLLSVAWIAGLSFGMVTLVGRTGCILNIDTYIMGLVVIAVGTSIPDALSSILVARDGYGDMAVSNAIGSNVFDINLGLGLPFIIRIAIDLGEPISLLHGQEWAEYYSGHMPIIPHAKFGFLLLVILAIALTIFGAAKFKLNKYIGISFVSMYVLFLIYAFVQELYCVRQLGIYC